MLFRENRITCGSMLRKDSKKTEARASVFVLPAYTSSTFTGRPVSMDLLHAMVNATDLNASA